MRIRFAFLALSAFVFACSSTTEDLDSGTGGPDASTPDASDNGKNGRVVLSSDTLDFGAVVVTSTASMTLTITNNQTTSVQVTLSEPFGPNAERFRRTLNIPDQNGT